jgi:hypothetical protein
LHQRQSAEVNFKKSFTKSKVVIGAAVESAAGGSGTSFKETEMNKAFQRFEAESSEDHKTGKPLERLWVEITREYNMALGPFEGQELEYTTELESAGVITPEGDVVTLKEVGRGHDEAVKKLLATQRAFTLGRAEVKRAEDQLAAMASLASRAGQGLSRPAGGPGGPANRDRKPPVTG